MFRLVETKSGLVVELYGETFGPLLTPCEWVRSCPGRKDSDEPWPVSCTECPAVHLRDEVDRMPLDRAES